MTLLRYTNRKRILAGGGLGVWTFSAGALEFGVFTTVSNNIHTANVKTERSITTHA